MTPKTGWLEKYNNGRVVSMVEVKYHRVKVKKTPRRKKGQPPASSHRDESHYYVLDKKVSYGEMYLTGSSVFSQNEIIELQLFVARFKAKLRLLARIKKMETFHELKRPMFRGDLHFAAVSKEDFENLRALEAKRLQEETVKKTFTPPRPKDAAPQNNSLRLTFKRG